MTGEICFKVIFGLLCAASALLLTRLAALKKQIRSMTRQIRSLAEGETEKQLDISLIDRDLEQLAGALNEYQFRQRALVAGALRHEERLKASVADVSHDLRTPLTVIMGHLQLLLMQGLSEEPRKRVETALAKARRMEELTEVFYELSVLEEERSGRGRERINLTNFLMEFLAENAPLFERKKLRPQILMPEKTLYVTAASGHLERILQNLLANAVRYSAGFIRIALSQEASGTVLLRMDNTVRDPEAIEPDRLFDRFYTGERSRHGQSTGLGLAVVKLLAEKQGGSVAAQLEGDILSVRVSFE